MDEKDNLEKRIYTATETTNLKKEEYEPPQDQTGGCFILPIAAIATIGSLYVISQALYNWIN